ncbi:MAG: site-specific integrase [Rhodobacteraceae bacterium]|nr:site-specific integrase [Paracoccaceae bacterium]
MPNEDYWDLIGKANTTDALKHFCEATGIPEQQEPEYLWAILDEIRKAQAGVFRALLEHGQSLDVYDFRGRQGGAEAPSSGTGVLSAGTTLSKAVDAYFVEHEKTGNWTPGTIHKRRAALGVAMEWYGPDIDMTMIGKQEASGLKDLLLSLPANRSKTAATRDLTLREAVAVPDVRRIGNTTVNSYLGAYKNFWAWAEAHGYAPEALFDGLKVGSRGGETKERTAFTKEALSKVYVALTDPSSKFHKNECHRWATLIAMFTGARLNEVCQLQLKDIRQEGETWLFDFTEAGEDTKRLKSKAAQRRVPVHSQLIELGLLGYHTRLQVQEHDRLFPDYTYSPKQGYGDKLSKWFNRTFTKSLGIKSDAHVFHGLRHTFATRLNQADVETARIQFIIGHERLGVTHQVYMKEGYSLQQTKDAVERFAV